MLFPLNTASKIMIDKSIVKFYVLKWILYFILYQED